MSTQKGEVFGEAANYELSFIADRDAVLLDWKHIQGLSPADFRNGILDFARQCAARAPVRAVIDATKLDFGSPAIAWLQGQKVEGEDEDYDAWWMREIVPLYDQANIQITIPAPFSRFHAEYDCSQGPVPWGAEFEPPIFRL
ncbi:MAG: hypothetical protein MPJ78_13140 [Hyphomicrobiaceae bacterium]|nr:hypothetical protein [Hyphomicrobiaceae bacterium]